VALQVETLKAIAPTLGDNIHCLKNNTMTEFTIAFDLHGVKDRSIYDSITQDILDAYNAVKVLNTTFIVVGDHSCDSLYQGIYRIISGYVMQGYFELVVTQSANNITWLARDTNVKLIDLRYA